MIQRCRCCKQNKDQSPGLPADASLLQFLSNQNTFQTVALHFQPEPKLLLVGGVALWLLFLVLKPYTCITEVNE